VVLGHGEDREVESEPLPDAARLDASLAQTIAGRPGVAAAVPDLAFPVQTRTVPSLPGHNWSAARISSRLVEGSGPVAGQVVVEAKTARAARLHIGDAVALTTPGGTATYRVAGSSTPGPITSWWRCSAGSPPSPPSTPW
jgi:putative ABC transport system permease protein